MTEAECIALYRRFVDDGVGVGRLETLDDVLAADLVLPTLPAGFEPTVEGLKDLNRAFRAGFPDLRGQIEDVFAADHWVAARLGWTGTNTGAFFGRPATGRRVSVTELEIVRCEGGRIVELRQVADLAGLNAQLG